MITILKNTEQDKEIKVLEKIENKCWINLEEPTEEEIDYVVSKTGVNKNLLKYTLDEEEISHIDTEEDQILISINVPYKENNKKGKLYTTMPLGILMVRDDYIITISSAAISIYELLLKQKSIVGDIFTFKKSLLAFQIIYITSMEFIKYLTYISKDMDAMEEKLTKSQKSSDLMKVINFQKSMIYFNTALKANESVMERLKRGKIIKLYEEDEDMLEDAVIENRQAIEMAMTYSEILNGMTEVFGTVVSNNLNDVMKLLTSITLIISIPTLISSILGMNVIFPFNVGVQGFYSVMGVSLVLTLIVTIWLNKKGML